RAVQHVMRAKDWLSAASCRTRVFEFPHGRERFTLDHPRAWTAREHAAARAVSVRTLRHRGRTDRARTDQRSGREACDKNRETAQMYERFTDRARKVMQLANQEAQRFNHEYIGTEHILLGLVKEGSGVAANVLKNLDIDLRKIRLEVEKIV